MDDLITFINKRLDEEQAVLDADKADHGLRFIDADPTSETTLSTFTFDDRLAREIAAKRAIVAEHRDTWNDYVDGDGMERTSHECRTCETSGSPDDWPCPTIRAVATVWSDHPDYQAGWAQ